MKIGLRTPSLKKSLKARTTGALKRTAKKAVNPLYGKKGVGLLTNPKKSLYNKAYNKTSFSLLDLLFSSKTKKNTIVNENVISEEQIGSLIEDRMKDDKFKSKLEKELNNHGYTMDDFYNEVDKLNTKSSFDGYNIQQRVENFKNSQVNELISVDILVLWYIKNKKTSIDPETLPRYFNYGYHVNFIERLNFLIRNGYLLDNGEKYLYTEKGKEIIEKYDSVIKTHFGGVYDREKIDKVFNKIM